MIIPSSVTSIGSSAFEGCSGLTFVELHCNTIGEWFNENGTIKEVVLGDEVKSIGGYAFSGCSGLTSVTIPSSVTYIGGDAFTGTSIYHKAPYGVFYIGNWALGYKGTINSGTEINIKEGTANLAGYSLNNKNISCVILPSTMKYICSNAFNSAIGTITITSDSIVQIGNHSFSSSNRLFVPTGTKSAYQNAAYWKNCTIYENTDVSQTENAVYIAPADVRLGQEPVVEICLKNAEDAAAYSFDVQFNGSVVIDEDELSERHTNHTRTFTNRGNGKYSFAVLSSTSDNLSGNDGAVRRVRLRFTSDTPANVPVTISNAVYSRPDGTSVKMGNVETTINVHDFAKGDVNGDGEVDIADAVCVVKHVVGDNSVIFKERPADVNEDNGVDIADAVSIVNMIIGKKSAAKLPAAKFSMREPQ